MLIYYHKQKLITIDFLNWKGDNHMKISRDKINILRARKKMSAKALAEAYGVSRARIHAILSQNEVSVVSAGRLLA